MTKITIHGKTYDHIHWTRMNASPIDEEMGETTDLEESEFNGKICAIGRNDQGFFDQLSKYMDVEEYPKNKDRLAECIMEYRGG